MTSILHEHEDQLIDASFKSRLCQPCSCFLTCDALFKRLDIFMFNYFLVKKRFCRESWAFVLIAGPTPKPAWKVQYINYSFERMKDSSGLVCPIFKGACICHGKTSNFLQRARRRRRRRRRRRLRHNFLVRKQSRNENNLLKLYFYLHYKFPCHDQFCCSEHARTSCLNEGDHIKTCE